ncbi:MULTISPECIES: 6-phosphogluconate phosphatase [Yersinia]|uniref:6-phosphogluconate phosphatase n=1 Tax=Yersinia TaxID=629 RepID=UPI0005DCE49A|nr:MULTISPECIES: 6-phosphogluconate phosphatase [Yersinia]OVZ97004.1 6-phosphogluconate phosphatase [Yersinia frederiksenii]RXA94671.1 6-phosphogluconate phosphatase [Yersinia sp. 2105 StPb PI]CNI40921.1 6-phosphogluconate phosphatase [Yersinia frederiksenii]CNI51920.1 6-phosphogluconate phosphatase [Yersinia frederiksenii]CNK31008.1 6-phosphogluconate phosphatase [Yersinia frederiksenii]
MNQIECVMFDCDGTLVDSEVLCCRAYVVMFAHYDIHLSLEEVIKRFKGVKLNEIVALVSQENGLDEPIDTLEKLYRAEVARLFDAQLQPIAGAKALLEQITLPVCVVSNGPVSKMQHSLGLTGLLPFFEDRLYSGYDIQRWKPDPALIYHAAQEMQVATEHCILVEDSAAGTHAGVAAGIPVFYYCADPHNQPIHHPLVTMFDDMQQLPELWRARGWDITRH